MNKKNKSQFRYPIFELVKKYWKKLAQNIFLIKKKKKTTNKLDDFML